MRPPALPRDPAQRRAALDRGRVCFITVAIALVTAAVGTAILIHTQEQVVAADPLVLQEERDGQLVDKELVAWKQRLVERTETLDRFKQTAPDPKTTAPELRAAWAAEFALLEQGLEADKRAYRARDRELTQRYFDLVWRFQVGAWLLAGAGVVLVLGLALGRFFAPSLPRLNPVHPTVILRQEARLGRWFVAVLIALLAGGLTLVALNGPNPPPSFGYDPAAGDVEVPDEPPGQEGHREQEAVSGATTKAGSYDQGAAKSPPEKGAEPASDQVVEAPPGQGGEAPPAGKITAPVAAAAPAAKVAWTGTYEGSDGEGPMTMTVAGDLRTAARPATFGCTWQDEDYEYTGTVGPVAADGTVKGTVTIDDAPFALEGTLADGTLSFSYEGESMGQTSTGTFTLRPAAVAAAGKEGDDGE